MVRVMCLYINFPLGVATSGAAGYLYQKLRGSFQGPEVHAVNAVINIQNANQGNIRKVMTLG